MARFPKNPFAFRPASYANIKRAFERRIARHHGFRNAPRAPAATNAATAKAPARDTLTRPDGMGLSRWFPHREGTPRADADGATESRASLSRVIITGRQSQTFYSPRSIYSSPSVCEPIVGRSGRGRSVGMSTDDSAPKASKVGILAPLRAKNAASAIENSEGLVQILRLPQADLRPAEDAIHV